MAGTNKIQQKPPPLLLNPPAIILVRPQLGENIGMCARAMLNCAVTDLRIVNPRDGWPNLSALTASAGAIRVVEGARVFPSVEDALADLDYVLATTARERGMVKDLYTPDAAAIAVRERTERGSKCGILFGPERTGLENDDVARANAIIHIPLNPGFSSLNLAQAVLLVCHAWLSADNPFKEGEIVSSLGDSEPAKREEIENLMHHLEDELEKAGFFRSPEQRPTLIRNIRNFFFRSGPTQQEVRTLHGVFACLTGKKSWK